MMNLLEIYITDITKEEEYGIDTVEDYIEIVIVEATYSCYGNEKTEERPFLKSEWAKIKKDGYYMG